MNDNEKTETENAINWKLDALKVAVLSLIFRGAPVLGGMTDAQRAVTLKEAWKEQEEEDPLC